MPELPPPKHHQHPLHASAAATGLRPHGEKSFDARAVRTPPKRWGELAVLSNYTFLGGASHPEELVEHAARLGHSGIALTDFETFGGAVRAHVAAKSALVQPSAYAHEKVREDAGPIRLAHGTRVRLDIGIDIDAGRDSSCSADLCSSDWRAAETRAAEARMRRARHGSTSSDDSLEVLLYPTHRASWATLCLLLTRARSDAAAKALRHSAQGEHDEHNEHSSSDRRACATAHEYAHEYAHARSHARPHPRRTSARLHDLIELLAEHRGGEGVLAVIVPPRLPGQRFLEAAEGLVRMMPDRVAVALRRSDEPHGVIESERACVLAEALGVPVAAVNDIRMHGMSRRPLLDTLRCIRDGTTLERAAAQIAANAERRLRSPAEVFRRFGDRPEAIDTAWRFLERASAFSLDELRYEYPDEIVPRGVPAMQHLRELVWKGARERYPRGVPPKVARQFEHEFAIINDLAYAPYFLTVQDIVAFARSRGILCQGRGAAANSAVCFALGITAVDPDRVEVLFERFVSRERSEPPDIDIDFEHERREEVIQHIYAKYGRHRAALVCEVISYRGKSAVRDVGKALGFAPDAVERLASAIDSWSGGGIAPRDDLSDEVRAAQKHAHEQTHEHKQKHEHEHTHETHHESPHDHAPPAVRPETLERIRAAGLDPSAPLVRRLLQLVGEILGFPRHRSQHVGGFVISRGPLAESVPIENAAMKDRTVIEWDKDDIEALGMLKIDLLSLGMLTAIRKTIDLVNSDRLEVARGAPCEPAADAPAIRRDLREVSPPPLDAECLARVSPLILERSQPPSPPSPIEELRFHSIPAEDPQTYDMMCKADTIGVFQIESRAQMSMLPRLRPRRFYDLVIEVALVRPGPIQGNMVHPYLRRRNGEEVTEYPNEAIRTVLGRTLGVPLFQEQAMALAVTAAGFTAGQADELRRAIAAWKRNGNRIAQFGQALEDGMINRGYTRTFATQVFEQIKGFAGYGFPESHAASFALLVYASGWLKRHHPAAFTVALLNSQPLGFYAPAQLLRDATEHGVAVRGVDIHCSQWDSTLERGEDRVRAVQRALEQRRGETPREHNGRGRVGVDEDLSVNAERGEGARVNDGVGANAGVSANAGMVANARLEGGTHPLEPPLSSLPSLPSSTLQSHGRFQRLHSRGRSGVFHGVTLEGTAPFDRSAPSVGDVAATDGLRAEPLCAPSPSAPCRAESDEQSSTANAASHRRFHVPSQAAVRLGLRMVRGLEPEEAHRVCTAVRQHGPFRRMDELLELSGVQAQTLRCLAAADAFTSMGLTRQQASWQILALRDRGPSLWSMAARSEQSREDAVSENAVSENAEGEHESTCESTDESTGENTHNSTHDDISKHTHALADAHDQRDSHLRRDELEPNLPAVSDLSQVAHDFEATGVSLKRHPLDCIRDRLQRARVIPCSFLREETRTPTGRRVTVAGLVLVRQRPSTAKGVVFMTIEDESGVANLIYRPKVYELLRAHVRHATAICARGKVERRDGVVHVLVTQARNITQHLVADGAVAGVSSRDFH